MKAQIRYLLVTHIPFARNGGGVELDALWLRDLEGLRDSMGRVTIAAPQVPAAELHGWGPNVASVQSGAGLEFVGFASIRGRRDLPRWLGVRRILHDAVAQADLVHTTNFFPPYLRLAYAHETAVKLGKKTLFVIAEDFIDMLGWEWNRLAAGGFQRWRRDLQLRIMDRPVRRSAASASLTFMHTPATVRRYRMAARNSIAIRQPGHETGDVIGKEDFENKRRALLDAERLIVVGAARHRALKGFEFLIMAAGILKQRGVDIEVRIYGEGPATSRLKALCERLDVGDRVSLAGALPPGPAIYAAIAAGHLFAMPHRTTDFGRAFYDAMAGATPVVAFRTESSVDTVRDGVDGWLCALDDAEALAARLERLDNCRALVAAAAVSARERALRETRSFWFGQRAEAIYGLFEERR
ncbi:MAG TPA: glycosyltransferase [Candidatus Binataceae bacterium]|nr:glycosyltransferase [Candidatus Binataceae bacterium]